MAMALLHHFQELGAIVVVHRQNHAFQAWHKVIRLLPRCRSEHCRQRCAVIRRCTTPVTPQCGLSTHQPSENARLGTPFSRSLHAAGARKASKGNLRRVEPEVHAGSYLPAKLEIVIVEETTGTIFRSAFLRLENPAMMSFPAPVIRMRLAGIHDLEVAGRSWQSDGDDRDRPGSGRRACIPLRGAQNRS